MCVLQKIINQLRGVFTSWQFVKLLGAICLT